MKINLLLKTKYALKSTSKFDKGLRKAYKQGKDIEKLSSIVKQLANGEILEEKYKNHKLIDDKDYKNCFECHIEPDWLLIYKYIDDELILILQNTGSHSKLFDK